MRAFISAPCLYLDDRYDEILEQLICFAAMYRWGNARWQGKKINLIRAGGRGRNLNLEVSQGDGGIPMLRWIWALIIAVCFWRVRTVVPFE